VSQLRHMVANTQMQCVYGYRACIQEVNDFLMGIRYDDTTRRRIVQHLCRRRPSLVSATSRRAPPTSTTRLVPAETESTSGDNTIEYDHLRTCMFSYSSADSTTDGATELSEAGSTAITVINNNTDTSCKSEVAEMIDSDHIAASCDNHEYKISQDVQSTDDVRAVTDVHTKTADADETSDHVQDDVLSPVWRPW